MSTNQTKIIRFDGNYFSYTDNKGNLIKIPAISGKIDSQNSQFQNIRDKGPIPEGFYDVRQSEYENIKDISGFDYLLSSIGRGTWKGIENSWGTERVWLNPQDESKTYGRDNFSIHGGLNPGSSGCIDLVGNAPTFFNFFKSLGSDAVLQVDYGSGGYNGLNNPLTKGSSKITIEQIYADQGKNLNEIKPIKNFLDASKSALEKKLKMSIADEDLVKKLNNYDIKSGDYIKESKDKKIIKDNKENNEKLEDKIILAEADGIGKFSIIDDSDYFTLSDNTTATLESVIKMTQTAKEVTIKFADNCNCGVIIHKIANDNIMQSKELLSKTFF